MGPGAGRGSLTITTAETTDTSDTDTTGGDPPTPQHLGVVRYSLADLFGLGAV